MRGLVGGRQRLVRPLVEEDAPQAPPEDGAATVERLRRELALERKARADAEDAAARAEGQLGDAQARLQRAIRDMEQVAHAASHDLQEPLRMVASFTQILGKRYQGKLDADADEYIAFAVDGAKRMQTMIADLLAYSRVGRDVADASTTDANAALRRALARLHVAIEASGGSITHDPLPAVAADESELIRVFELLIDNALKFRGDDALRVHVSAAREGVICRFSIRDNGIGIRPEDRAKIFGLFRRLHAHTKYPGTGMGLAVARRILERMGGEIGVDSEPGKGSTFFFTLPAASPNAEIPAKRGGTAIDPGAADGGRA